MHPYDHCKLLWAGVCEIPAGLNMEGTSVGLTVQTKCGEFITGNVSHEILQIALRSFQFNCSAHSTITKDYTEEKSSVCLYLCVC